MLYYFTTCNSPLGKLTLASCNGKLAGLWTEGQKYFGGSVKGERVEKDDIPVFASVKKWLERYFAGEKPDTSGLPLAPAGSEFRQTVWKILLEIPYGKVATYKEVAKKAAAALGLQSMSCQAVGGAVGHNPISVIIPCHRVIGASGSLTGYAGGLDKKIKLLQLEGADISGLFIPN